ncbi:cytoskeleton-associated protein 5-like [Centruroides sculpturatus]|uniref:cytoskeleton-associated protein 5-like n=1 Tax=Centruroides sculpturatus TaxID=218467 RepID=UPI000C6EB8D4|nr:cytoskeleton-associated protein 5-like [Centruroides sculpturatus]
MDEEDITKLSIEDRCQHKVWKVRVNGYEEASKLFNNQRDEKSPEFQKYLGLVKKFVVDNNVVAQEKGLCAVLAYVENAACAGRTCGEVMNGIVTKCMGAPKAKTKELALDILMMYIEIEKQDVVQEELLKGLENKNPKIVSSCTFAFRESLKCFGLHVVNIKPLIKVLPKLFEDRDKTVREEAKLLMVEIYRWIKDAIRPQLQSLKPVQITELEAEFEKVVRDKPVPTRFLRSQQEIQAKAARSEEKSAFDDECVPVRQEIDPFDLIEAVDILSKLPKDFYERCEAKKWQERKEAVEQLFQLTSKPKLEAGDYSDLVKVLKKFISKDTNVLVVALAGKCLAGLANGLRKKFQPYAGQCIPVILEKFKEKKQNVVQALREAIDAIYESVSLEFILDDTVNALDNKNPQIRAETAAFLARCYCKCTPMILSKKLLKPFCVSLIKTLNDTDPSVREASADALGTALKVVGEKAMAPFLQEVDSIKMAKVKESCEKAVIVAPQVPIKESKPLGPPKVQKGPRITIPSDSGKDDSTTIPTSKRNESISRIKSATFTKSSKKAIMARKNITAPPPCDGQKEVFMEKELNDDEVMMQASELLGDEVINGLGNTNWKERLSATEKFLEIVQNMNKENIPAQVFIKILAKKPGFKENNFQVLKLRFDLLIYITENASVSKVTVETCLSDIVDKIGDPKNGSTAALAITTFAEATNLEYISQEVLQHAFSQRNPKNHSEAILWLANAIKEFGLKVNVKTVIDYLKKAFASTNQTVRNSALVLLGSMYLYVGKSLRTFFEDEKPALLQLIDNELTKLQDAKPPPPTRGLNYKNLNKEENEREEQAVIPSQVNLTDIIPRTDISDQITSSLLTELSDKNWKVRGEALQKLSTIVNEAKFITPNLGDLPHVLKARLTDSNKNLSIQSLNICQMLGTAMGPHCVKQLRNFAPGMLAAFGDNKTTVRNAAISCLNTWMEHCNLAMLFEGETVSDALRNENPYLRIELLGWLSEKLPEAKSLPNAELTLCIPYILSSLEDRNGEVRKKAQESLLPFMIHVGFEAMSRAAGKLKPASKNTVMAQLEKVRTALPAKPVSKPKIGVPKISNTSPPCNQSVSPINSTENLAEENVVVTGKGRLNRSTSKSKLALKAANTANVKSNKKEQEEDTSPALVANNLKDQRMNDERALKVLKWNFTTPREEFYQQLKDQMTAANWGRTLLVNCFHNDFKYHIKAIDTLNECLSGSTDATVANLDLILKWLALRFFDTNPSVIIRGLEYLQQLFNSLVNLGYRILELEAVSFVPYLILKMGDPKDTVRKGVREILKLMCQIYPSSKIFSYIMQGLSTKNSRQRTECLEELGFMIESYGMAVCQPSPAAALKEIARHIADRDNGVRNASLNCVVQAYFLEGEKVYKFVGQLSDKDMSLLEERIKRSRLRGTSNSRENQRDGNSTSPQTNKISPPTQQPAVNAESQNEAILRTTGKGRIPRPRSTGPFSLEVDDIEQMFKPKQVESKLPEPVEINAEEILNLPDIQLPQTRLRPPASAVKLLNSSAEATVALNLVMAQLAAQEIPVVVEAFAQVEEVLRQEDKAEAVLGSRVDQLLLMGALQYRLAHNKHMADENICKADVIRLYRCVSMTLLSLFDHKTLAKRASRDVLRDLIPHLITVMLDTRLNELQEGPQVVRAINVLTVHILQRSNPTHVMSALIKLLHDCVGSLNASERFTELVMKCLWKMLRMMGNYIDELNVDRILLDLHVFLKTYPSSYWRDRPSDTPIRTVKTVLYTLVKYKGEDITKHLMLIPNRQDSDLVIYLQKLIYMRKDGDLKTGSGTKTSSSSHFDNQPETGTGGSKKSKNSPMRLSKSTHESLAEIFKKIGSKEHTKEGLMELYEFRQKHPQADIEPFLQRSSEFFQDYIRKGLETIDQERGSHKTEAAATTSPSPFAFSDLQNAKTVMTSTPTSKENQTAGNNKTRNNSNTNNWSQNFPPVPPDSEDTTPMDWIEWLKSVAAHLGQDSSKYDDPTLLQRITETPFQQTESGIMSEEEMKYIQNGVEELKAMLENFKQQYYKEMCVN